MIYNHEDKEYDFEKLSEEAQRSFRLLALAEDKFAEAGNTYVLAQAATVAMHTKVREFLSDEALVD